MRIAKEIFGCEDSFYALHFSRQRKNFPIEFSKIKAPSSRNLKLHDLLRKKKYNSSVSMVEIVVGRLSLILSRMFHVMWMVIKNVNVHCVIITSMCLYFVCFSFFCRLMGDSIFVFKHSFLSCLFFYLFAVFFFFRGGVDNFLTA